MADNNPFDAFDDSARPATGSNPFDAFDDDAVVQKRVAENPDLQAVMSRFARSRVDDISATARRVPDPEAFTSLDERTRGKAVQGELQAAEDVDQRAQAAVRDAQARGDGATYGAAVEAASEAGRRLAQARKLDEDNRAGIVRQASPEQQLALGNAIAAQKKRIDYLNDQIEQADSNPAFLPEGRRIEDVRAELQLEMQALNKLEAGRGYGEQRQAFTDPSAVGEFGRGVARGALGTVPEMLGGAAKQAGADGVADVLRDFGRGVRRDTAAEAAGEILKLGEKGSFGKDLKNFVSAKFGEGLGTSLPIIAAYMAGGPAGTVTGVSASAALGIGQMRNSLEDAFAEQGVAFPEEHAARYVYLYGTAIGALESLTEVTGMRALTGDAKRQAVRSIGRALAAGAARGAAMEGVTEALQEAVEMYGVTDATGKPLDYAELRRRMTEGFAAGAVPGAAFGAFTGAASNKAAFDLALEKAKELGFGDAPQKPQDGQRPAAAPAEPAPTDQPPAATSAPADATPVAVVDPVGAEQAGTAALDVVDSLIPDGTEVDREMAGEAAAVVSDALGLEVADPADESAAAQQAAEVDAEERADATTLDAYLAEGGSLSRSAIPALAKRLGVAEADLPGLLDKAVDAGTLRKTAGGMYRRPAAEPQAAPSEFRQAERQRRAMEAIDEALNFGRQILPKDVTIEVADSLNVGGYELDALSDTKTGNIALAVYANNPKARLGHEGLHTLVTRGHVSPAELALLAETARTSGVWTAKAEAEYRDAYAGRANLDGLIAEEAAAHLVEARIRGQDFGPQANAIIEKIKKVLERIRRALQSRGLQTADDVIDALMSGDMAKREARAEWMRDAQAEARPLMQARARQGVELPGGIRVQGVPLFAIRAFHGSPHDFDRFSIDKIGSGEGAQVYGRGLYFAESEDIARWYRDSVADKHEDRNYTYDRTNWRDVLRVEVRSAGGDRQRAIKALEYEWVKWGYANPQNSLQRYRAEAMSEAISRLKNPNFDLSKFAPPPRRLYEVRIDVDPDQAILDWDAPLSEQSSSVRSLAQRRKVGMTVRGGDFYRGLGESADATRMLMDAGIFGVKYLDANSRRRGNGTRNFVIFDDALIEIVAKDGVPVERDEAMFALSDASTGRSMRDDLDALGFYSAIRGRLFNDADATDLVDVVRSGGWEILETKPVQDWLRSNGYDGFKAKTGLVAGREPTTIMAVMDTSIAGNIRRTDAAFDPARADSPNLLYAMATDAEARPLMQARAQEGVELPGGVRVQGVPLFAIRAFHGSPHDFDRFDMSKIGTGEGAQAYGHGLYFAENEGVARSYRDGLSKWNPTIDGKPVIEMWGDGTLHTTIAEMTGLSIADAQSAGNWVADAVRSGKPLRQVLDEKVDAARRIYPADIAEGEVQRINAIGEKIATLAPETFKGRMYEVSINADPEDFLDWDKPLSEQSEKVREMFHGLSPETQGMELYRAAQGLDARERPKLTGDTMRDFIAQGWHDSGASTATKRGASEEVLKNAGIPGIRYLDQGSRGAGDGSRNYVVFDDKLIEIVVKDGVPVARGNAMFAMSDSATGRSMREDIDSLGYYSGALRAAKAWPQSKGTVEQALMWLKKSGVKEGEIEATGLAKVIEGQKAVTRDEIIAHLEGNRVGMKEKSYDRSPPTDDELARLRRNNGSPDDILMADLGLADDAEFLKSFDRTKWSSYSLDPGNPSYRETVLHLPVEKGKAEYLREHEAFYPNATPSEREAAWNSYITGRTGAPAEAFRSGHFPEPNITGHMMTSMVKDADGRPVYLIDQIQSDWGQKLRDGGVRDEAKIAELKAKVAEANARDEARQAPIVTAGLELVRSVYPNSRSGVLEDLSRLAADSTAPLDAREQASELRLQLHNARLENESNRLMAELRTAEAATPGHPLVNTTDQWVNTTLRRALMQAAEADAEFIAIPSGKTVESYNPQGDSAGNAVFYDQIVPKNLRNLLRKLDKQSPDPVRVAELETPTQGMKGEGFAVFEITPEVKRRVMEEGQALFGLSDVTRRFMPSRNESLAGINSIVRDLAHDLGITVRQGLTTPAAKTAKRQARKAGTDISSYYDPATGVLRVTSMSDLTAILTHAGEAIIRRYDAAKGRVDERGARDVMNPLERLISRHAFGLLGTYRGKLFGQIEPKYSGMHLAPVLRETLTQYLQAWHNANVATMNRSRDPGGYAKAQRELTNAQRMVARYMGRKLTDAIAMEKASVTSVWGLVQGKVDIAEIRDYVDIRYNQHSTIKPPPPADPLDPETQRAAFGKWFTTYISDRPAAEAQDPALFEAFEDLIDTTDPVLSAKLDDASDAIAAYAKAEPVQIVTSMISSPKRFGNIAAFFQNIDRDGLLPTLADGARMLYRGGWDDLHPWYTAVRQLLETHRVNTGAKLDLEAAENAYKLLRLGRHSGAWAGRDLEDGIKARASNAPEGPSLVQALQMALGSDRATALDMGQDGRYAQFNAYLIARRAVRLWDRFYDGTLPNPPLNASRETAVATIQKLEGEFPSFVGAADLVYEFQTNLLKLQRDAGIITPETFETLAKEPDYVPFIRDMTDKDEASSRVLRGAQSIIRKIKGSDRNIMDPIATIAQKVYETRQIIATNDAKLALLKLADAAGPGGGAIAERLDPNTSKAMRVNLKDALRNAADELGVSRADANALVELAQELLGDQMVGTVFGKGQMNTAGQNITWLYENGIPVPMKLADGNLGNLMMRTLQTFGSETTNIIVEMMAVPAAITRSTVTAHPSFILRNGFVDGLMAWMYDRQATPWVTQAKGFVAGLMETEKVRAYARSAGLMGGPSTSALDRLRFDRDVRDLVARGYQPKVWESPATFIGELVRHPIRNIALMSEASETGTRARLYELAYDRAIKTGLNPREAAAEAAFYAHDYMDYSRHGSTVQAWSKLVPFMNAALQGMDRYARLLVAKGDYGSAWMPYLNYRLGRTETLELTEREKAELAQSVQAWMVSTLVMGGISMAVSLIWAMRGDDDLQDVPQEIRATHWVIPLDGVYHLVPKELPGLREALKGKLDGEALRLPKGFDNAWFANLVERLMVDARQGNPRWFENYLTDMSSILNPPMEPQALKLFYEMKTGKDFFSGRDIIPKWKQERFPEMMWDEYTSEFAKWAGKKTGTAPYYIDHALKQLGTSWARDAMSLNVPGLPWYDPTKPEKSMDDYFIARRFLWKIGKGSEAAGKVREIMGPGDPMQGVAGRLFAPYSRLDAAAETYKEYLKRRDPASGSEFLDRLRPPERAYAILDANVEGDNAKMKMVHPIHRADKLLTEVAGVQKEILGNLFESRKRKKNTGELIPLAPSEKRAAIDILTQYKMMEAHNALVVAGETGYAQRALFDTGSVMDELRAAVPDVADEFEKRLKKAKVIPFQGVREQWPQLRQVLESADVAALSKAGDKRGVAAKVREFYALAKSSE